MKASMVLATFRLGWAVSEATALTMLVLDIDMIPPGVSRASMVSTDTGTPARDEVRNNEWGRGKISLCDSTYPTWGRAEGEAERGKEL